MPPELCRRVAECCSFPQVPVFVCAHAILSRCCILLLHKLRLPLPGSDYTSVFQASSCALLRGTLHGPWQWEPARRGASGHNSQAVSSNIEDRGSRLRHIPAGTYLLSRHITVQDRAVAVRGDGIGVSRLVWQANARSVGLGVIQVHHLRVCIRAASPMLQHAFARVKAPALQSQMKSLWSFAVIPMHL